MSLKKLLSSLFVFVFVSLIASPASADWNPGEPAKWYQLPDDTSAGMDICIDNRGGAARAVGDDFPCIQSGPITGVHLWVSWNNDFVGSISGITLSIYSDNPMGPGGFSQPDILLWQRNFLQGEFTTRLYYTLPPEETETFWDPRTGIFGQDTQIWQLNFQINPAEAFVQEGSPEEPVIYWLVVEAQLPAGMTRLGWKTRAGWEEHFNDDAVFLPTPSSPWESMLPGLDMAFVINSEGGIGACCEIFTGNCYLSEIEDCEAGWNWLGSGTDCSSCQPQQQFGACCNEATGDCSITEIGSCPYTFLGVGSDCSSCQPPPPPPPPPLPPEIRRFEINQCFQDVCSVDRVSQMYDLIETKPFLVKVTLQLATIPPESIPATVKLEICNALTGKQIGKQEKKGVIIRYNKPSDVNFVFDDNQIKSMKADDYKFSIMVKNEVNDANFVDWWKAYTFKKSKTVRFLAVLMLFLDQEPFPVPIPIGAWNPDYIKFAEQVFPVPKTTINDVNHLDMVFLPSLTVREVNANVLVGVMNATLDSFNKTNEPNADFICVVAPEAFLPVDAVGARRGSTIRLLSGSGVAGTAETLGHEMGHINNIGGLGEEYISSEPNAAGPWILNERFEFDRNPPPVKLVHPAPGQFIIAKGKGRPHEGEFCDWANDPNSYSAPVEKIEAGTGNKWWWCRGRFIGKGGYNVDKKSPMPSDANAMMGGGSGRCWISGPEYKSLREKLTPTVPKAKAAVLSLPLAMLDVGQRLIISGIVNKSAETAELNPLVPAQNLELSEEADDPNCRLVFKSSIGEVLGDFNLAPLEGEEPDNYIQGPFSVVVDIPADTVCIQVVIDEVVADELQLTDNSPTVEVLSPNGGEEISGEMLITWSASDADINDINNLRYTMEFSHNNGADWSILTMGRDVNQFIVDSNYLPGGPNCMVKVTVSDGWNYSEDISDAPFSVTTKPPMVTILDPEDWTTVFASESIQGRCLAYDPETDYITDPNAILWSSNIDGFLGDGDLTGFQLSLGCHILSATATDPEDKSGTDMVTVRVIANIADFNFSRSVDFLDFAVFAVKWRETCLWPDWCEGTDFNQSGGIDSADLEEVAENWLWQESEY